MHKLLARHAAQGWRGVLVSGVEGSAGSALQSSIGSNFMSLRTGQ